MTNILHYLSPSQTQGALPSGPKEALLYAIDVTQALLLISGTLHHRYDFLSARIHNLQPREHGKKLGEFEIRFMPHTSIKSQARTNLSNEWIEPKPEAASSDFTDQVWTMSFDRPLTLNGSGEG